MKKKENASPAAGYAQLQNRLDKVVGKIGVDRTIFLLDSFVSNTSVTRDEQEKIKMVTQYLVNLATKTFDLKAELFYGSQVREYKDARMCCYHLLRKYTQDTFAKIGLAFGYSERIVTYGCERIQERLDMPKAFPRFIENYTLLETKLIDFIGRIN